jgi:hypothetical protein
VNAPIQLAATFIQIPLACGLAGQALVRLKDSGALTATGYL